MKRSFQFTFWMTLFFLFSACEEENENLPSISFSTSQNLNQVFPASEDIEFEINIRTNPDVGIEKFVIKKENQIILERANYTTNAVLFTYGYITEAEDALQDQVVLSFELTDNNGDIAIETAIIKVEADFPYKFEQFRPEPSWDFVTNRNIGRATGDNIDLFQTETPVQVGNQLAVVFSWIGKNGTFFYDGRNTDLDINKATLSRQEVLDAIATLTPLDSVFVSRGSSNADLNIFFEGPIIANIRGKDTYAIIDRTFSRAIVSYRKESENAGE